MDFPRPASDASGVSWPWGSCPGRLNLSDHRCLHQIRRSLLLHPYRIELSSSKKILITMIKI